MASHCKAAKGGLVLWQTLFPSALAGLAGSLRTAYMLSLQGVLVTGVGVTSSCPDSEVGRLAHGPGTDQRSPSFQMSHLAWGAHQRCTDLSSLLIAAPCLIPDCFHC